MALKPRKKKTVIEKFRKHAQDTGSADVQIALLTEEISSLTKHLAKHPKDHSSRRGLLKMVGKRRALLKYLEREEPKVYAKVTKELGLS